MLELQRVQIRHKIQHIRYDLATSGSWRAAMNSNEVSKCAIVYQNIHIKQVIEINMTHNVRQNF